MFFYFDWTYFILVLPAVILAVWASARVKSTYRRFGSVPSARGISGAQAARMVLDENGLYDVKIEQIGGELTDHFDPKANVVRLSADVYNSTSVAAIGIACHEVGHAVQHATGYFPIKIRSAILPLTNFGSKLAMPLLLIGLILSGIAEQYIAIAYLGVLCFALSAVFQLVTLPTEFNASARAMRAVRSSLLLSDEEQRGTRKVLTAAALTYVAALVVSLAQVLRLLLIVNRRRN